MLIPTILTAALAGITDDGLLENTVHPTHQLLQLEIDPYRKAYSGHTVITLEVTEPTDSITLHADGLFITKAKLNGKAELFYEPDGAVTLELKKTVPVGTVDLEIDFTAKYGHTALTRFSPWEFAYWEARKEEETERKKEAKRLSALGKTLPGKTVEEEEAEEKAEKAAFKEKEKNPDTASQVTAMLRPGSARYAFPSFDEPQIRNTFQIEITTPAVYTALTNMPERSNEPGKKGTVRRVFEVSPEMPAQMVGFAVGKMESVAIEGADVPGRLYFQEGVDEAHKEELLQHFGMPMKAMGDWFGTTPFPERNVFLMASGKKGSTTVETLGGLAVYPADTLGKSPDYYVHPAAHSWFGGTVSPKSWSDVWLMEALPTFVEYRIANQGPHGTSAVASLSWDLASHATSGGLVQEDVKRKDVSIGADAGSHKAALILEMLDAHAPGKVQEGIRAWLAAGGSTDLDELLAALAETTGVKAEDLKPWFENAGLPVVTFTRTEGGFEVSSATFESWPQAPEKEDAEEDEDSDGEEKEEEKEPSWTLPFAGRTAAGTVSALIAPEGGKVEADGWLMPTNGAYVFRFADPADLDALVDAHASLTPAEHLYLLANLNALMESNQITPDRVMRSVRLLAETAPPEAAVELAEIVRSLRLVRVEDRRAALASIEDVFEALASKVDPADPTYAEVQIERALFGNEEAKQVLAGWAKQAMEEPAALTGEQLRYGMIFDGFERTKEDLDAAFERIDDEFEEHPEVYFPQVEGIGYRDAYTRKKVGAWFMREPANAQRFEVFANLFRVAPEESLAWLKKNEGALLRVPDGKRATVVDIALEGVCDPARVDEVAELTKRYKDDRSKAVIEKKRIEAEACATWQAESREAFLANLGGDED